MPTIIFICCSLVLSLGACSAADQADTASKRSSPDVAVNDQDDPGKKDELDVDLPVPMGVFTDLGLKPFGSVVDLRVKTNEADRAVLQQSGISNGTSYPGEGIVPRLASLDDMLLAVTKDPSLQDARAPLATGKGRSYAFEAGDPAKPRYGVLFLDKSEPKQRFGVDLYFDDLASTGGGATLDRRVRILFREASVEEGSGHVIWITEFARDSKPPRDVLTMVYYTGSRAIDGEIEALTPAAYGAPKASLYKLKLDAKASLVHEASLIGLAYPGDGEAFRIVLRRASFSEDITAVGQDAVIPGSELAKYGKDAKAAYGDHPESQFIIETVVRRIRNPSENGGACRNLGDLIRGAFGATVPPEAQALPADLCAEESQVKNRDVWSIIEAACVAAPSLEALSAACQAQQVIKKYKSNPVYTTYAVDHFEVVATPSEKHVALKQALDQSLGGPDFSSIRSRATPPAMTSREESTLVSGVVDREK